jgi:hypothetical protein
MQKLIKSYESIISFPGVSELLGKIIFETEEEKITFLNYIVLKGFPQHKRIVDILEKDNTPLKYRIISGLYKYDKRIRDDLYIYLSALEEYLRAYICNSNRIDLDAVESMTFGELINFSKRRLDIISLRYLFEFDDVNILNANLDAVKELRNAVNHHRFLYTHPLKACNIAGATCNSLSQNILNLKYLLPKEFHEKFLAKIQNDALDEHQLNQLIVPDKYILVF